MACRASLLRANPGRGRLRASEAYFVPVSRIRQRNASASRQGFDPPGAEKHRWTNPDPTGIGFNTNGSLF